MNETQGVPTLVGPGIAPAGAMPPARVFHLRVNPGVLVALLCILLSVLVRNPGPGIVIFLIFWVSGRLKASSAITLMQVDY